jgi:hypothetical protein
MIKDEYTEKMNSIVDIITKETQETKNIVLPIIKELVTEIRSSRMSISNEVKTIIDSFRSLQQVTKYTNEIHNFTEAIIRLQKAIETMPPNIKVKLEDLFHD